MQASSTESELLEKAILNDDPTATKAIVTAHLQKFRLAPGRCNNRNRQQLGGLCTLSSVASRSADCVNYYYNRLRSHSSASIGLGAGSRRPSYLYNSQGGVGRPGQLNPHDLPGGRKLSHSHPLQSCSSSSAVDPGPSIYGPTLTVYGQSGVRSLPDTRRGSVNTTDGNSQPGGAIENLPVIFKNALHVAIQNSSTEALSVMLAAGLDPNAPGCYDPCSAVAGVFGARASLDYPDCVLPLALLTVGCCPSISEDANSDQIPPVASRSRRSSSIFARLLTTDNRSYSAANSRRQSIISTASTTPFGMQNQNASRSAGGFSQSARRSSSQMTSDVDAKLLKSDFLTDPASYQDPVNTYTIERLYDLPPIYLAVALKNKMAVRILLRHGADPRALDPYTGFSPLHLTVSERFASEDCANLLTDFGAKVIKVTNWQKSDPQTSPTSQERSNVLVQRQKRLLNTKISSLLVCSHHLEATRINRAKIAAGGDKKPSKRKELLL